LVDLLDLLVDFLADFFVAFLADFFVDLLDFLDDLERADVLAMDSVQ
jgi:hypothetical protein